MRNIVVCVKACLDTTLPLHIIESSNEVVQTGETNPSFIISPSDRCAIEEAMCLKSHMNSDVIAVSLGSNEAVPILKYCLARGLDRCVHLSMTENIVNDPQVVARILAQEIIHLSPQLVVCGDRSIDNGSGQVGPILAEYLNLPQITGVTKIIIDDTTLTVQRKLERGSRQVMTCKLPVLLTVTNYLNQPRYVSIHQQIHILDAKIERKVIIPGADDSGWVEQPGAPKPRPRKMVAPPTSLNASDRLKMMMSGGQIKKTGNIFEGDHLQAAEKIYLTLIENGVL
jgi:electron transfer flavoprotein beta subunit